MNLYHIIVNQQALTVSFLLVQNRRRFIVNLTFAYTIVLGLTKHQFRARTNHLASHHGPPIYGRLGIRYRIAQWYHI